MNIKQLSDFDLKNKRVLIRADLNVPISNGTITSDARITASMPTIEYCLNQGAKVMVTSHLGRPTEGVFSEADSLKPVADLLSRFLNQPIKLIQNWSNQADWQKELKSSEVVLLENCRFNVGEKKNDVQTAKAYAALCDVFIMDAFGTAHRAQASTYGVAKYAPQAGAGLLLMKELSALSQALANPEKPMVAIVGGSKVSTKLTVLESLSDKVDQLIVGGGIANTFIAAQGHSVGQSLHEPDLIETTQKLIKKMADRGASIPIARDVVVGKQFDENEPGITKPVAEVSADEMIFDLGPDSMQDIASILKKAKTIVWNGPVGVFEFNAFANGTETLANAIAASAAYSLAGGGDTIAAIQKFGIENQVSYISTAGGAFLEYLEGKTLPAVAILEQRYSS